MAYTEKLKEIANAIRNIENSTELIKANDFSSRIIDYKNILYNKDILYDQYFINALFDCSKLTSLPEIIKRIADYAFYNCTNLALTSLPEGIYAIGDYAFYNCTNLALTSLPERIYTIGDYAFYGCTNLTLTSLPSQQDSTIHERAFCKCTNLALTSLPELKYIRKYAFYGCTSLALTSLPYLITTIEEYAFYNCPNIDIYENRAITIGDYAFSGCTGLKEIELPRGPKIGNYTFRNCTGLTTVYIGSNGFPITNTQITANSFSGCKNITSMAVYTTDGNPLSRAPFGATNATISYIAG